MKLRLFTLRDIATNRTIPELFFSSKPEAKRERDARNALTGEARLVVAPGPDHYRSKK